VDFVHWILNLSAHSADGRARDADACFLAFTADPCQILTQPGDTLYRRRTLELEPSKPQRYEHQDPRAMVCQFDC